MTNSPRVTCFGGTRPVSISGGSIFQIVLKSMAGSEVKNGCRLIASIPSPLPPSRSVGSRTFVCNTQTSTTESLGRGRAKGKAHEELLHEIFRVGREFGREVVLELDNLLEDEVLCSSLEGRPPGKYLIQDAAEAPIVGSGKFRDEVNTDEKGQKKRGAKERTTWRTPCLPRGSLATRTREYRRRSGYESWRGLEKRWTQRLGT